MKVLLLGNGEINDYVKLKENIFEKYDKVISVDGGAKHLGPLDLIPDLMIGDFDSISEELLIKYKNSKIYKYNPEKNQTDSEIAFDTVEKMKAQYVHCVGFTGSRLDHSMSNMLLLLRYKDLNMYLIDENNIVFNCAKTCRIKKREKFYLSLVILSDIEDLKIEGVKYPLDNKYISFPSSLTLSNEITEAEASISFSKGNIIAMLSRESTLGL
ncbi:MAG: thiamine diphosphokinase [Clostridiales bacterium]|nr:thiamine diphosphokinase [Clostridiales bacterium]